jgi:hypothetical protein
MTKRIILLCVAWLLPLQLSQVCVEVKWLKPGRHPGPFGGK